MIRILALRARTPRTLLLFPLQNVSTTSFSSGFPSQVEHVNDIIGGNTRDMSFFFDSSGVSKLRTCLCIWYFLHFSHHPRTLRSCRILCRTRSENVLVSDEELYLNIVTTDLENLVVTCDLSTQHLIRSQSGSPMSDATFVPVFERDVREREF